MLTALLYLSLQIDRDSKDLMNNCFDQTTDINIFTDTNQLIITVQSLFNSECDLPSSVLVSVQLDSLVGYEPYSYAYDYDYNKTTQFVVNCTDLVKCANLKNSLSGQIFIESKSDRVIIPAGSVRISQGHTENCFYNDLTVAQIATDLVTFKMYPTPYCNDLISFDDSGVTKLKQPLEARVYVNYPDGTMGAFENLAITMTQVVYSPDTNTPILLTVQQTGQSQYFSSKGLKFFTLSLFYLDNTLKRIVDTFTNQYAFVNPKDVYSSAEVQITETGFMLKTIQGPDMVSVNQDIRNSGSNSVMIYLVMTMKNVSRTFEFRTRVKVVLNSTYQFTEDPEPYSCSDYPGQQCLENLEFVMSQPQKDVSLFLVFYLYGPAPAYEVVNNYSIGVSKISDSCFKGGLADYTIANKSLNLTIYLNNKSEYCVLVKDDLLAIKVTNTKTKEVDQVVFIYGATAINTIINDIDLKNDPEIQIDIYRENILEESLRITNYVLKQNSLVPQMAGRIGIVSAVVFFIVACDAMWMFWLKKQMQISKQRKNISLKNVKALDEEDLQ
ncbi:Conserved_hypothetical protein [Hexamita inflata]|uniref:Transmembrane protein n=1 Tax=Hexamita inflata TaxID=28002 RepID=A0AA86QF83_9EUKA|nr:Conserved hypothetical protein [Hexamita inflata]